MSCLKHLTKEDINLISNLIEDKVSTEESYLRHVIQEYYVCDTKDIRIQSALSNYADAMRAQKNFNRLIGESFEG